MLEGRILLIERGIKGIDGVLRDNILKGVILLLEVRGELTRDIKSILLSVVECN